MMIDGKGFAVIASILATLGFLVGFALWAFRVIPAWGILVATVGAPIAIICVGFVLIVMSWMASGSH